MTLFRRSHLAMATRFEALLAGGDDEHLEAVSAAIFEETDRVERLLSRFDPASETFRVNQHAAGATLRLSVELAHVIADCRAWWERTEGHFDITIASQNVAAGEGWHSIAFDASARTIRFALPGVQLDFGGFGKGYALDRAGEILARFGIEHALLHGGTSSVLARGRDPSGAPWRVGLRSLAAKDVEESVRLPLTDVALSTSWSTSNDEGCTVLAADATTAEVLSTALLMMGEPNAERFLRAPPRWLESGIQVYWSRAGQEHPKLLPPG
jgi:thiamine biosynthesis lipoprotein